MFNIFDCRVVLWIWTPCVEKDVTKLDIGVLQYLKLPLLPGLHQKIQQGRCIRIWSEPIQQKQPRCNHQAKWQRLTKVWQIGTNQHLGLLQRSYQWLVAPLTGFKIQSNLNIWKGVWCVWINCKRALKPIYTWPYSSLTCTRVQHFRGLLGSWDPMGVKEGLLGL